MHVGVRFFWGLLGSIAVEIVSLFQFYSSEKPCLPDRYKKVGFWVVRLFLALIGGGFAVAYEIQSPILAVHIGAATPLIVQNFAKNLPPDIKPDIKSYTEIDSPDIKPDIKSYTEIASPDIKPDINSDN